jgi:hypothetical protein
LYDDIQDSFQGGIIISIAKPDRSPLINDPENRVGCPDISGMILGQLEEAGKEGPDGPIPISCHEFTRGDVLPTGFVTIDPSLLGSPVLLSAAAWRISSRLQKQNRIRFRPSDFSSKKLKPGTAATPISWTRCRTQAISSSKPNPCGPCACLPE